MSVIMNQQGPPGKPGIPGDEGNIGPEVGFHQRPSVIINA